MPKFFQTADERFCQLFPVGFTDSFLARADKLAASSMGKDREVVEEFCARVRSWPENKVLTGFPRGFTSGSWRTNGLSTSGHSGHGLLLPAPPSSSSKPEFEAPPSFSLDFVRDELAWLATHRKALVKVARKHNFSFPLENFSKASYGSRAESSQKLESDCGVPDFAGGTVAQRMKGAKVAEPSALEAFGQARAFAVFTSPRAAGGKGKADASGYLERLRGSDDFTAPLARASLFESEAAALERVRRVVPTSSRLWSVVEVKIRAERVCARSDADAELGELAHAMAAAEADEMKQMLEKAKIDQLREKLNALEARLAEERKAAGGSAQEAAPAAPRKNRL